MVSIAMRIILLVAFMTLSQELVFAHNLDPNFENPFQLRRDVAASIDHFNFTEAIAIQGKYFEVGNEECRRMALFLRSAYLPKELPVPPRAEALLKEVDVTKSWKEKISLAKECANSYPDFEYGHFALAYLYSINLEDSKAEKECLKALSIAPSNVEVLTMLGIIYINKGETMKARRTYEQLLKLDPKNIDAAAFFGEMNRKDGKLANLRVFNRQDVKRALQQ